MEFRSFEDGGVLSGEGENFSTGVGSGLDGGESEVDRLGSAGGNDEVDAFCADSMGEGIFRGIIGFANTLGGKIWGRWIEEVLGKIRQHGGKGPATDRSGGGVVEINHVMMIPYFCNVVNESPLFLLRILVGRGYFGH